MSPMDERKSCEDMSIAADQDELPRLGTRVWGSSFLDDDDPNKAEIERVHEAVESICDTEAGRPKSRSDYNRFTRTVDCLCALIRNSDFEDLPAYEDPIVESDEVLNSLALSDSEISAAEDAVHQLALATVEYQQYLKRYQQDLKQKLETESDSLRSKNSTLDSGLEGLRFRLCRSQNEAQRLRYELAMAKESYSRDKKSTPIHKGLFTITTLILLGSLASHLYSISKSDTSTSWSTKW